ncbi:MAG: hypothetical protein WC917_03010 [Bacilli bacterium]|jgi:hypothetical protein
MNEKDFKNLEVVFEAVRYIDIEENMKISHLAFLHNFSKEEKKKNIYKWAFYNAIKGLSDILEVYEELDNLIRR